MGKTVMMKFEDGKIHDKPLIYLAGAMPRNSDNGKVWRKELTPTLKDMGYRVWDPYMEECHSGITPKELASYREENKEKEYAAACRRIVDHDLNVLRFHTDIVLAKIDKYSFEGAGTWSEMTFAYNLGIPVIGWINVEGGYKSISGWAVGCMTKFSSSVKDVLSFIPPAKNIQRGKMATTTSDSWFEAWRDKLPDI